MIRVILICFLALLGCRSNESPPKMEPVQEKRILLVGDSIMLAYHSSIIKNEIGSNWLKKHRVTLDATKNLGQTEAALLNVGQFLTQDLDVIHFNFGLHDIQRQTEDKVCDKTLPTRTTPTEYKNRLRQLVKIFRSTGAVVVFATTTPVPDGAPCQIPGDVILYNQIAIEVMGEMGVEVNDLYSAILHQTDNRWKNDPTQIHFNGKGNRLLGQNVISSLKQSF